MTTADLAADLSAAIRAVFSPAGAYLSLVTRNNPHGSAEGLLSRPDVAAVLSDTFDEARSRAFTAVQDAWGQHDPETSGLLAELLADAERAYSRQALALLHAEVRQAWDSVPPRVFVPGVTEPGANPALESAAERAQAVQDAVEDFARRAALRNGLSADVAAGMAGTLEVLADAPPGARKRWRAHVDSPSCCFWCRRLHGVTLPLHASFAPYLGLPADLTGHGHLTQPPKPYRGWLQGPPAHPHCACYLEIIPPGEEPEPVSQMAARESSGFVSASDIRALPEGKYRSLTAFLRAAVYELGQVLSRLGRVLRRG